MGHRPSTASRGVGPFPGHAPARALFVCVAWSRSRTGFVVGFLGPRTVAPAGFVARLAAGGELGCVHRTIAITDSGASRSPIPEQADHRFRSKPITDSGASRSLIPEQA